MQVKKFKKKNKKHHLDITTLIIILLFIMASSITFTVCFIVIKCSLTELQIVLKDPNYNPHATKEFTRSALTIVGNSVSSIILYCLGVKSGSKNKKKTKD